MAAREELDVWWQRNDATHTVLRVMHSPLSRYEIVSRVPRFPRHGASTRPAEFCPVGISGPCRSFFVPGPKEEQRNEKEGEGERERKKNGTIESSESDWSTARCRLTDPVCAAGQTFASTTKPLRFDNDERIH